MASADALAQWRDHVDAKLEAIDHKLDEAVANYAGCSESQRLRWLGHEKQHDQEQGRHRAVMAAAMTASVASIIAAAAALVIAIVF